MKIIKNNFIPFKGFSAINLFGFVFTRRNSLSDVTINHEEIHTEQMKELGYIFFYILYFIEWVIRLFSKGTSNNDAYYAISFEREAYANEYDPQYIKNRKAYSWIKYL